MGWLCTGCGERHRDEFKTCWKCGGSRDGAPEAPEPEDGEESNLPQLSPEALAHEREAIHQRAAEIRLEMQRDGEYPMGHGRWNIQPIIRLRRGLQLRRERHARYHPVNELSREEARLDALWSASLVLGVSSIAFLLLSLAAPPALTATLGLAPLWVFFVGAGGAFALADYLTGREITLAKRYGYYDSAA
jgi:hypothetical protein